MSASQLRRFASPYVVGIVPIALASVMRLALTPWLGIQMPFPLFFLAILASSCLGGWRAGALATATGALVAAFFFIEPLYSFDITRPADWFQLFLFIACGLAVCWVADIMLAAKRKSARQARLLDQADATVFAERRQAEQALRESEQRFRRMTETIREVFWMTSPDFQTMHYISPAFEQIWGHSCAELYANPQIWMDAIHPDDVPPLLRAMENLAREGEFDVDYRITRPDGSLRWINARGYALRDEAGCVTLASGVASDITERKQVEEALRESEERYRTVADHTFDWEYWLTPDGKLTYCSPSCERVTGYRSEEFISDPILLQRIVHPDDAALWQSHLLDDIRNAETCSLDWRIVNRQGETRWISHVCASLRRRRADAWPPRIQSRCYSAETSRRGTERARGPVPRFHRDHV